jgi:hypothetical protein
VAAAPTQEHELAFAATYLPACNGYAGLIRVFLAISRVFLARMRRSFFLLSQNPD